MARIEKKEKEFVPYRVVVETQQEHAFLLGLFMASGDLKKKDCINYNKKLDYHFWDMINDID